jgi:hypothetical protein
MDFLFAIPSFIFNLISGLFSWVFGVISGIVGIVLWPVKLLWGLLTWVGKTLISIVLLPTLLFSHPGDLSATQGNISATQPVVATTTTVSDTYNLEQIYKDINNLQRAGRDMEYLRTYENSAQCGIQMRKYQSQAQALVNQTNALPKEYSITLGAAAIRLNMCVSCKPYAAKQECNLVLQELSDYQSMMSEE